MSTGSEDTVGEACDFLAEKIKDNEFHFESTGQLKNNLGLGIKWIRGVGIQCVVTR